MVDYKRDIRFGYGLIKGRAGTSSVSMPKNKDERYPNLTPTIESLPDVVRGRSKFSKFAKAGDSKRYKSAVEAYYTNNHELYLSNAIERLRFTTNSHYTFYERLVYFWENHLAVMTSNKTSYTVSIAGYENEAIRPNVDGHFYEMLTAAATHPVMLMTLDQHMSMGKNSPVGLILGRGSNENFARELMELYTLGAEGGYSQKDVEEMAGLFSGLNVNYDTGKTGFYFSRAANGTFDILGKTYGGLIKTYSDISEVIYDLALHPSTADYVSRKLAKHFISDSPPEILVKELSKRFRETDGFLPALYEILLDFDDPRSHFSKVKTPLDYIVTALRSIGAPNSAFEGVETFHLGRSTMMGAKKGNESTLPDLSIGALDAMGHRLWGAPGPDGWPDTNSDWLHSVAISQRFAWASAVAPMVKDSGLELLNSALGQFLRPDTKKLLTSSTSPSETIILALMSPEFNRR